MVLKAVTDLERMGDLGVNISERVVELNNETPLKPYVDLPRMADETQMMLREALDAFVAKTPIAPAGSSPGIRSSMTYTLRYFASFSPT